MRLISLNKDPNISVKEEIVTFLNPDYVYIPILKEKLLVKQNTKVLKGSYIFQNNLAITSPISGKVIGLKVEKGYKYVVIQNDFQEKRVNVKRPNISHLSIKILLEALEKHEAKNLLNLFRSLKKRQNIIINVIDDEPYCKTRIMLLKENITNVLNLLSGLSLLYHSEKNIVAIKAQESSLIDECLNVIGSYPNINLALVDDLYLLGQNHYLLEHLKYDASSSLCLTIEELLRLYDLIYNNGYSHEKLITISGSAIAGAGQVFKVKKYTDAHELIIKNYHLKAADIQYVKNGLMRGDITLAPDLIITDDINIINIMKKEEDKCLPCFNCGKCVSICPVKIDCRRVLKQKRRDPRCLNCGLCNYICPSNIKLKEIIRGEE